MTQRFSFYEDLTVAENLDFVAARLRTSPTAAQAVQAIIERMGLADRADQLAGELSGGWKQRLALAACVLHKPKLLLLDEPTAGVDAKARREFWDLIHDMAGDGLTVLVSTHYMDEAERCARIVYLSDGKLVVQGTPDEVAKGGGLFIFEATGADLDIAARKLRGMPGVEAAAVFGSALHVAGMDRAALERATRSPTAAARWTGTRSRQRLEDVFIHLLSQYKPAGRGVNGFSFRRFLAVLRKEWIQVRRDPFTLRMIVALPVMQLFLFGYAINADPKHLPTGLLSADHSKYERTIVAALKNTGYYDIRPLASEAEAERGLADGELLFVVNIPPNFDRSVDRGEKPAVLMDADATDPVGDRQRRRRAGLADHGAGPRPAAGDPLQPASAAVSVRGACPLQPRAAHGAEHRAWTDLHRADHLDPVRHDAVDHPRNRARHDGESAGDAGSADRGDARQGHTLYRHRLRPGRPDHGDGGGGVWPADPRFHSTA